MFFLNLQLLELMNLSVFPCILHKPAHRRATGFPTCGEKLRNEIERYKEVPVLDSEDLADLYILNHQVCAYLNTEMSVVRGGVGILGHRHPSNIPLSSFACGSLKMH